MVETGLLLLAHLRPHVPIDRHDVASPTLGDVGAPDSAPRTNNRVTTTLGRRGR